MKHKISNALKFNEEMRKLVLLAVVLFSAELLIYIAQFLIVSVMNVQATNTFSTYLLYSLHNFGVILLVVTPLIMLLPGFIESKRRLKRLNSLLTAIRETNKNINRETKAEKTLANACKTLRDVKEHFHIAIISEDMETIAESGLGSIDIGKEKLRQTIQRKGVTVFNNKDNSQAIIPFENSKEIMLLVVSNSNHFDNEELRLLEGLADDIGFALEKQRIENNRKEAINQLTNNLTQFDKSADRLRNPLAVIMSSLEVANEIGDKEALNIIGEQAKTIKEQLDELRMEENKTYNLTQDH